MYSPDDSAVLRDIYKTMVEWVRFADQKISIMLAIHSAIIVFIVRGIGSSTSGMFMDIEQAVLLILTLSACFFLLYALKPRVRNIYVTPEKVNVYSYTDICTLTPAEYMKIVVSNGIISAGNPLAEDLSSQIVINSNVAVKKFRLIKNVVYFDFTIIAIAALYVVIHRLLNLII